MKKTTRLTVGLLTSLVGSLGWVTVAMAANGSLTNGSPARVAEAATKLAVPTEGVEGAIAPSATGLLSGAKELSAETAEVVANPASVSAVPVSAEAVVIPGSAATGSAATGSVAAPAVQAVAEKKAVAEGKVAQGSNDDLLVPSDPIPLEDETGVPSGTRKPASQLPQAPRSTSPAAVTGYPKIELVGTEAIKAPADGRSTVEVRGRVLKADGTPHAEPVMVTLTTAAGDFVGTDADRDRAGFQVMTKDGEFAARLRSPLRAQWVKIRAALDPLFDLGAGRRRQPENLELPVTPFEPARDAEPSEAFAQVEFTPHLRTSLVSGSATLRIGNSGTNFYDSFANFLRPGDLDKGATVDVDGSLFATGPIGEWLFTGALNFDRPLNQDCYGTGVYGNNFRGTDQYFCEKNYPIYGDSSRMDFLTPSRDRVYARLERRNPLAGAEVDYLMWGDYGTSEFARPSQLFSATTRNLHGAKVNYSFGQLQATALYSNNLEGFRRDTIQPNGTSGLYFLSKRLVLAGSENVFLEVEELNRPGVVVRRQELIRGRDYDVDYDRGTLTFRKPISSMSFEDFGTTLINRVVATYQYDGAAGGDNSTNLIAGRLQYNFSNELDKASWLGMSYVRENLADRDFSLFGVDFLVPIGDKGQVIGEYARSENGEEFLGAVDGSAYRLEAEGKPFDWFKIRAYYRSADDGFSNNATSSFTPGQTRLGTQAVAQVGPNTTALFEIDYEKNFGRPTTLRPRFFDIFDEVNPTPARAGQEVDNSLTTVRAGVQQKIGASALSLEYVNRQRNDEIGGLDTDSSQLVTKFRMPFTDYLTFRAQNEATLGGDSDELYPNRTTLGLEWDAYPGVKMQLAHQFFDGGIMNKNAITSLSTILDRQLSEDTTFTSRYSVVGSDGGLNSQGSIGLNHRLRVSPGFKVNVGFEHIFDNIFNDTAAGRRFRTPYAIGQTGAILGISSGTAYNVGFEYTGAESFKLNGRAEYRTGAEGSNFVASLGGLGKISPTLSVLGRYEQAGASNQTLVDRLGDTRVLRLGFAYRNPLDDKFNALLKYEYRANDVQTPDSIDTGSENQKHIFSAEAIYAPTWRWELYGKYAMRWAETKLGNSFSNDSTVSLGQLRAAYRLNYRWDIATEARWIGQHSAGFNEFGIASELGYYLTPDLRAFLGYSFGRVNDSDFGGSRSDGGLYGGLNLKINRLWANFGVQEPVPKVRTVERVVEVMAPEEPEPAPAPRTQVPEPVYEAPRVDPAPRALY